MSQIIVTFQFKSFRCQTTPSTLLNQVLSDSCKHFKVSPDSFTLKHGKATVDLSLPIRLSSLPQGVKLELTPLPNSLTSGSTNGLNSKVTIKLQIIAPEGDKDFTMPPTTQLINSFRGNDLILKVLQTFEASTGLKFFDRSFVSQGPGRTITYTYEPNIQSFSTVLSTPDQFNQPLSMLGLTSGNHSVRLRFRRSESIEITADTQVKEAEQIEKADELMSDINDDILPPLFSTATTLIQETLETGANPTASNSQNDLQEITQTSDSDEEKEKEVEENPTVLKIEVYKPVLAHPIPIPIEDESIHEPSIDQARLYQSILAKQAGNNNGPLMTKRQRDALRSQQKRTNVVKECLIRIKFPDQTTVQFNMSPVQTIRDLYQLLVNEILCLSPTQIEKVANGSKEPVFELHVPYPSQSILTKSEDFRKLLVADCGFGHRSLLVYKEGTNVKRSQYIKSEYMEQAKYLDDLEEVKLEVSRSEMKDEPEDDVKKTGNLSGESGSGSVFSTKPSSTDPGAGGKKIPKWLKLGKK